MPKLGDDVTTDVIKLTYILCLMVDSVPKSLLILEVFKSPFFGLLLGTVMSSRPDAFPLAPVQVPFSKLFQKLTISFEIEMDFIILSFMKF